MNKYMGAKDFVLKTIVVKIVVGKFLDEIVKPSIFRLNLEQKLR